MGRKRRNKHSPKLIGCGFIWFAWTLIRTWSNQTLGKLSPHFAVSILLVRICLFLSQGMQEISWIRYFRQGLECLQCSAKQLQDSGSDAGSVWKFIRGRLKKEKCFPFLIIYTKSVSKKYGCKKYLVKFGWERKAQTLNRAFCMGYRVFIKQTLTKHTQYISLGNKQAAKMVFSQIFPNK